jgi:very-short-patch-repair endonuclease
VCFERRLIIELDGSQHMGSTGDRKRDAWLAGEGFHVMRFWDNEVLQDLDSVEAAILAELEQGDAPSP